MALSFKNCSVLRHYLLTVMTWCCYVVWLHTMVRTVSYLQPQYNIVFFYCVVLRQQIKVKCEIKNSTCYIMSVTASTVYIKCLLTMVLCNKLVYWVAFPTLSIDVRPIPGLSSTFTLMRWHYCSPVMLVCWLNCFVLKVLKMLHCTISVRIHFS